MRKYLLDNSAPTCDYVTPKKRPLSSDQAAESEPCVKRALANSRHQLWQEAPCDVACSTFYRNAKLDNHDVRCATRQLDMCLKCVTFDSVVAPAVKTWVSKARGELASLLPSYWDRWGAEVAGAAVDDGHKFAVSAKCMDALLAHLLAERDGRGPDAQVPPKLHGQLHAVESRLIHELKTNWPPIKEKVGLVDVCRSFDLHFTQRDECKDAYTTHWDNPEPDTLYVHCDYKEHDQLPVGPREIGEFFVYAGGVQGVTVLTFVAWARTWERSYFTYASEVKEQSSLFAISCLEDVLRRVGLPSFKSVV